MKKSERCCTIIVILVIALIVGFSRYAGADLLEPSLMGFWNMDGDWYDQTANGHNGTAYGGATFNVNGKFGKAGSFNGSSYVLVGSDSLLAVHDNMTITAWVKTSFSSSNQTILSRGQAAGGERYSIILASRTQLHGDVYDTNAYYNGSGTVNLTANAWNYVVMVYKESSNLFQVYYNGNYAFGGSLTYTGRGAISGSLNIGRFDSNKWYMNGLIDDVAIWNRALSTQEMTFVRNFGVQAYEYLYSNLGYNATDINAIWNIYQNQTGEYLASDGLTWTYIAYDPDAERETGDAWLTGSTHYIKLGSGLMGSTGGVPEFPPGTIPLLSLLFIIGLIMLERYISRSEKEE